ncbi:MAG TPA: DUF4148 domain-containing protein [Blastocatellia bacterium]|nr:DUF4148 domain-containing protein [Blastocatellia bacterium]
MKKLILISSVLFLAFSLTAGAVPSQDGKAPLTRQELLALLKQAESRQVPQADIAAEVESRGIAFAIDEKALAEFQKAGARSFLLDSIRRAGQNPGKPPLKSPEADGIDPSQPLSPEDLARLPLLERARHRALEYSREVPNFIVTQFVTRYERTPDARDWRVKDRLEIELTYEGGKGERFKLLRVNGSPARQTYEEIDGSTSTGEFATMLRALFLPDSRTEFKEAKREEFNKRMAVVYDYRVRKENSHSVIMDKPSGKQFIAGYSGSVWVDSETAQVLRIEEASEGFPPDFPVTLSENAVEYDWVTIAEERYMLPVRAEVLLGWDHLKAYTRNAIEFKNYKKFETKIRLDPN